MRLPASFRTRPARIGAAGWLALWLAAWPAGAAPVLRVVYPAPESAADARFRDLAAFLAAALQRTEAEAGPYEILSSARPMTEARYLLELERGGAVNVAWSSTSVDKEQRLLPIRIPLRKGLLGYRVALIDARQQARIDRVQTLADLRQLNVGQGIGWGDVQVYRAAGIPTVTARYEQLFPMLGYGRFALLPRGVNEVLAEYEAHRRSLPNLAIERGLLLYYPWPYYFFCNRRDTALAQRLETGLRRMLADGSFDAIFWKYHRAAVERLDLRQRRIIRLDNPLLPPETPLNDARLWFDPTRDSPPPVPAERRP